MLAYINQEEANLLKALGGAGKPVHGVPAYYDEGDDYGGPGGDQSAGPDGQQGSGNNNAGPSGGGGREDGMDQDSPNSSSSSDNKSSAADDAVAAGKAEADSWSGWANTVGQNYANTQNQTVDEMGNITTQNPDGSTTTTLSQAQQDLNTARDINENNNAAGKLADRIQTMIDNGYDPNAPMDSTNVQLALIGTGIVDSGLSKSERMAALEDFGRRTAVAGAMKGGYNFGFMGPPNVNDILNNNPDMTQQEIVDAMARGFNAETGTPGIGYNVFGKTGKVGKGLFGDVFGLDAQGNLGIKSGWQNVGQNAANLAKTGASVLATVKGNPKLGAAISGFNFDTMAPLSSYDYTQPGYDPNAPKGANMNVNYDIMGPVIGQFVDPVTSKALGPLAKGVYGATNNLAITGATVGKVQDMMNQEIRGILAEQGVDHTVNVGSISLDTGDINGPNNTSPSGKGAAPKGSATADLQSDISNQVESAAQKSLDNKSSSNFSVHSNTSGSSGDSTSFANNKSGSIPSNTTSMAGTTNVSNTAATYNDKDGVSAVSPVSNQSVNSTNSNDSNDNSGDSWKLIGDQIQNIINEGQNSSSNVLNPISYNSPASTRGGGLRGIGAGMLTRGKNRDYGSATFRTASKNEIDRGARRAGFGNGIMFG
jgi:hypothetical protein